MSFDAPMNEFSTWPEDVTAWLELMADDEETADSYQQSALAAEQSMNANGSRG